MFRDKHRIALAERELRREVSTSRRTVGLNGTLDAENECVEEASSCYISLIYSGSLRFVKKKPATSI